MREAVWAAPIAALLLAACGGGKDDQAAYEACLAIARAAGSPVAQADFGPRDKAEIAGMQDSSLAVVIPYTLAGQQGKHRCQVAKQQDGTWKSVL